jgi:hypothetical protein
MLMSKPSRNATGKEAPGQIVNPVTPGFNRYEFLEKPIIQPKKLTFEEWIKVSQFNLKYSMDDWDSLSTDFERVWQAAQENK